MNLQRMMCRVVSAGWLVLLLARPCEAMLTQGDVKLPANSTVFIGKFCFTFNTESLGPAGKLNVSVWAPGLTRHQSVHVVMFDDEAESFPGPSGAWDALSCEDRMRHAKNKVRLDWTVGEAGQLIRFNIREHIRPRFWYIALADCSGAGLDSVRYEVHAANVAYGWASEFSTDKRYVLFAFVFLATAYGVLTALQVRASWLLARSSLGDCAKDKAAHPFARMLTVGIALGFVASLFSAVHFLCYASGGVGAPVLRMMSQLLCGASRFVLASLLLLASEGKCISYVMVPNDARRVARMLSPFLAACLLLEFWGDYSVARRYTTDYVYTTPFGWAIVFVDLVLLALYAKQLKETHDVERDTSDGLFYRTWALVFGSWFLALPTSAALSQAVLAPYVWCIVSVLVNGLAAVAAYAALVAGLWPGNTRTYFKLCAPASPEDLLERASAGAAHEPVRLPSLLGSMAKNHRWPKKGVGTLPEP